MSLGFSRFGLSLVLVWFAATSAMVDSALAQGKPSSGRWMGLSETNSAEILTNLNRLSTKKDEFKQLDEQLRMLKGISIPKSMEQQFSVPYVPQTTVPNKRMKELMERQKNWLTPEDMSFSTSKSDSDISSFEGTDKVGGSKSSLQQFYDALNRSGSGMSGSDGSPQNRSGSQNRNSLQDNGSDDDSGLPPEIRDKTKRLKDMVTEDPSSIFNPTRPHSNFENFFGKIETPQTTEQAVTRKTPMDSFLDQFKKGLDPSVAAGLDPNLSALVADDSPRQKPISAELSKPPTTVFHHDANESTPGKVNSVLDVTSVSDINETILNQWNPMYTPKKIETPKPSPPTPLNMEFPRRKF
jgi:hypothetical protein